jgi:Concanavalin A-like lectin/glucanases superfamily
MKLLLLATLTLGFAQSTPAAVTTIMRLGMGEVGTLGTSNKPIDTVGSFNLTAEINGAATTVVTSGLAAAGSTAALNFNGSNQGFYGNGGDMSSATGNDNFGVELWVRTPDVTQENYDFVFSLTGDTGPTGPAIHLANSRWSASIPGLDWIGGSPFAPTLGGVPAVANQWTRVAVVRNAGVFSLYVDGVAHPSTTTATPGGLNGFHMAVNPGGATYFQGDIDEVRVFTFAPGAFHAASDLYAPVPEPTSLLALGLAVVSLSPRRRRA